MKNDQMKLTLNIPYAWDWLEEIASLSCDEQLNLSIFILYTCYEHDSDIELIVVSVVIVMGVVPIIVCILDSLLW